MVNPTFKKSNISEVDTTNTRYGAPDWKYATDVLDGQHPTDRVQITNIEGYDRIPAVNWIVRKKPTDATVIEILSTKTGLVYSSGPALCPLLKTLNDSSDFVDGHQIWIKPSGPAQSDAYVAIQGGLGLPVQTLFTKTVTIWGYGAKIRGGTTSHQNGGFIRQTGQGKSMSVYGLTMDASEDGTGNTKRIGVMISAGDFGVVDGSNVVTDAGFSPKLVHLRDCSILNTYNRGVHIETQVAATTGGAPDPGKADSTILLENCLFDSGNPGSIQTFVGVNSSRNLIINNCAFIGNNICYSAADNISVTNCYIDENNIDPSGTLPQGGNVGHGGLSLQGRNIYVSNCTIYHDSGTSLRSYGTIHAGFIISEAQRIVVEGCTIGPDFRNPTEGCDNVVLGAYDDSTHRIKQAIIRNCYFVKMRPVQIVTADPDNLHGKVDQLIIENCYIDNWDASNKILLSQDHDIGYLRIANVKTPAWPASSSVSPVDFQAVNFDVALGYYSLSGNSSPQTGNEGYVITLNDPVPNTPAPGNLITCVMDQPLSGNQNIPRMVGGTLTDAQKNLRFLRNSGKATLSGNGSALTFTIPHLLVSSPANGTMFVSPGSTAARGDIWLTADATNITVNYPSGQAPASGTNNVVFYWSAVAA